MVRRASTEDVWYWKRAWPSVLTKTWYCGVPPHCSAAKTINGVVVNKAGPTLVATWQVLLTFYSLVDHRSCIKERNVPGLCWSVRALPPPPLCLWASMAKNQAIPTHCKKFLARTLHDPLSIVSIPLTVHPVLFFGCRSLLLLWSEATRGGFSAALGSTKTLLLHAQFSLS